MNIALHWFRSDLRIDDNPGLYQASKSGLPVAGLYIATPRQWDAHDDAPIKRDFWKRNLLELKQALAARGIPLLCLQANQYKEIPALMEQLLTALPVHELHFNLEVPLNERRRDEAVLQLCKKLNVKAVAHRDQSLLPPNAVLNKSGEPFKVFTPFSKTARLELGELSALPSPTMQTPLSLQDIDLCKKLEVLNFGEEEPQWSKQWPAGEREAHRRLTRFCQHRINAYKEQRDFPVIDGTSTLSPYLAAGVLSVKQCWLASPQWQDGNGVHTWQNELLWRDFYRYVMWHYPHVCQNLGWRADVAHVPWRHDENEFQTWCEGRTGIPLIDAAMRQLLQTGWMHNRLRMVVAMFLSKHLLIDWRWGERWFMQHLIDGDFASNNGGWQWSVSTGTDAVPYFRIFNPVSQSRRFDPEGTFIKNQLPGLAELDSASIHDPGLLRPADYPPPMIDLAFGRERALNAFRPSNRSGSKP